MNEPVAILFPSIAMALLTLTLLFALGMRRWVGVQRRVLSIKYYQTFSEGTEPETMRRHTRHVQNHFEIPPLFHLAVFATCFAGQVTPAALAAAWLFVATRCVHAAIHLGYNNVTHRFFAFGTGVLCVAFLWGKLLLDLL